MATEQKCAQAIKALAEVLGHRLGPQGAFSELGTERTEEILLLLLREDMIISAHERVWTIPIPDDLLDLAHAAGGKTRAEWEAEREGR